ncbi:MAG: HAMP domain-containing protein, partial [Nitrospinae bacterium]|nr:HAMP domain-containing protein [Nitrospinota bacterium]
ADQIETYIRERYRSVKLLSQSSDIIDAFTEFEETVRKHGINTTIYSLEDGNLRVSKYAENDRKYRPYLTTYLNEHSYEDLYLISMQGDIIFSIMQREDLGQNLKTGPYATTELAKVFIRATTLLETEISTFAFYPPAKEPSGFIAAPIFDGRKFIGVVAIRINNQGLYKIVNNFIGLRQTGEVVMGAQIGNFAVFMAPLRFDKNAAFKRKIAIGAKEALPIQQAVQKQTGSGTSVDYRGHEVLAYWKYLPLIRWGMVVKIDTQEAFSRINQLKNISFIIGTLLVLFVVITTFYLSKTISDPLVQFSQVTQLVADGDLTRNVPVSSNNEIGQLAVSFNTMMDKLNASHTSLKETNVELTKRSEQLTAANKDLSNQIIKRVRTERELKFYSHELERSNKGLEEFAYLASHDLHEPLRKIITFSDLVKDSLKGEGKDKERNYLERMQKSAQRMQTFIDDLLEYSRVSTKLKPFKPVDINEIVKDALDDLELQINETKATIQVGKLPTLPADAVQITKLFQNLISNALKYHRPGIPPVVDINSSLNTATGNWEIAIKDNGIGLDEKYSKRIFQPFERLHDRNAFAGTGIGLAICKKIIHRHHGTISVRSQPDAGATFTVTLPQP